MDNQSQNGVNGQNMGCNMNGYSPLPSWFVPPNYIYQQPMQGNNPDQPIPFPSISAPPPYSFQSSVVTPMQQTSNDEVIDLANSASDDDSSDEPISENDSETHSSSAPDFDILAFQEFLRQIYERELLAPVLFGRDDSEDYEPMEESEDSQIINIFDESEEEESSTTRQEQVAKAKDSLSQYCCPICLEPPVRPVSTTCGHIYCSKCMRQLFRRPYQEWKCPLCTKHIRKENVHPIFF